MGKKKDETVPEQRSINQPFQELLALRASMPEAGPATGPVAPGKPAPKPRFPDKLVLQREKKGRGGKTVTRLRGLSLSARELERLAGELKKGLGCGASVDGSDVLLQGDQCQRAADWLAKQGATKVVIGN